MFFNVEILCMQKSGKFAKVWIAATRGTGSFSVKEVLTIDLEQTGNEIAQYISSTSAKPRNRFSLVLSSKLICGLARLYEKKATIYLNDVFKFLCHISKPGVITLPSVLEPPSSEPERRPKQKRPKKKAADSNTPDVNVKITPDEEVTDEALKSVLFQTQAPEEMITLREAATSAMQRPLEEEIFGIGTITDVEVVERTLYGAVEPSLVPQVPAPQTVEVSAEVHPIPAQLPAPQTLEVRAEVHPIPAEKRPRSLEEKEPEKRKRRRTTKVQEQAEIQKEAEFEKVPPEVEQPVAVLEEATAPKQPADIIIVEKPPAAPQQQVEIETEAVPKKRRVAKPARSQALIQKRVISTDAIYGKPYRRALLRTKRTDDQHPFKHFCFTITDVGNDYILESIGDVYANDENVQELLAEMALDLQSRDSMAASISLLRARSSGVPIKDVSGELTPRTLEVPSLRPSEIPQPELQMEEKMTAIEEETIQLTHIANGDDKDIVGATTIVETTLPPAGYVNGEKEVVVEIAEDKAQKKKKKGKPEEMLSEKKINHIVVVKAALQKWNWDEGFPTIEDVCPQPINRLNISITFFVLLELYKQRYVILVENPETLELEHIEKGPEF